MCLQLWSSHPWGKHIPKDCRFCWQQALGDTATDDLEPVEDGDVHSRLAHNMQENQVIKAQLSKLMELVWQQLPQPGQATLQLAVAGSAQVLPPPADKQAAGTSGAELGLPPPLWLHTGDPAPRVSLGGHQPLLPSHAGQPSALLHGNPLPAALASPARQVPTTDAQPQQPWPSPVSPGTQVPGSASSLQ